MSHIPIHFFNEETNFKLKRIRSLRAWLLDSISREGYELTELNFIFCSDDYLLKMNQEYLQHDTYTDTITFDNSEIKNHVLGDIFISIDRVKENAKTYKIRMQNELHRVMIHSTLHLLGYKDKSIKDKDIMTSKEDYYLKLSAF